MRTLGARLLDGSAIGLSTLCLIHCLILPVVAAVLPVLGAWADAEWVHALFVVIAAPMSALALFRKAEANRSQYALIALATGGLALLVVGAFWTPDKASETAITVLGSLCLAAAHLCNWRLRAHAHSD